MEDPIDQPLASPCLPVPYHQRGEIQLSGSQEIHDLVEVPSKQWAHDADSTVPPGILIIPGTGKGAGAPYAPRARRRWTTHLLVGTAVCALLATLLVTMNPLDAAAQASSNPFRVLAQAIVLTPPPTSILYRVQPGDTFESIAAHFGVAVGGIYQLNHLYMGAEAQTGEQLRVSTDGTFGAYYTPPSYVAPGPPMSSGNSAGGCVFCVQAGWTNGPGRPCAAESSQPQTDVGQYALSQPEIGAHWVRGFTAFHNGVDLSTGVMGTPIQAAQAGVVIFAGWDPYGFGWSVKINHCGGLATSYGHMQHVLVTVGQSVTPGQTIGFQGSSGMASGPHLHFMIWWDNTPADPLCAYDVLAGNSGTRHNANCPAPQLVPGN